LPVVLSSPGTPASSTTKTGHHDIAEILLKVALKHQKSNQSVIPPKNLPKLIILVIRAFNIIQVCQYFTIYKQNFFLLLIFEQFS
jgi:hypothetical protein